VTDRDELINGLEKHSYGQHFRETGPDRKRRAASVLVWESVIKGDSAGADKSSGQVTSLIIDHELFPVMPLRPARFM
jgi:hypothetical protein